MTKQILLSVCYLLTNTQNACVIEKHECSHISLTMTTATLETQSHWSVLYQNSGNTRDVRIEHNVVCLLTG